MTDYERAINFVLDQEGYGNIALAGDPGGLTIWGIAARYWPAEVKTMQTLSKDGAKEYAKEFYKQHYWDTAHCSGMDWPLNLCVLDASINCGIGRVSSWLTGDDWQEFLCNRARWQINKAKSPYMVSLLNRIYRLLNLAKGG